MRLKLGRDKPRRREESEDDDRGSRSSGKYRTNMDALREYADKVATDSRDDRYLELVEGVNYVRVLPPWSKRAKGVPFRDYMQHRINSDAIASLTRREAPDKSAFSIVCLRHELDEDCPVCEYQEELLQRGKSMAMRLAKMLRPETNTLANGLLVSYKQARDNEMRRGPGKPQIWRVGPGIRKTLVSYATGADPELGDEGIDFTDPETGRLVIIKRVGVKMQTKYPSVKLGSKAVPLPSMKILKKMFDLDAVVAEMVKDYDAARDALNESAAMLLSSSARDDKEPTEEELGLVVDDDDDDDDDRPRKRRR